MLTGKYPKAKIGYYNLGKLINALGDSGYSKRIIYLFDSKELVLEDPQLEENLKLLGIPYEYIQVENSIKYINREEADNE
jgi:hypothetical protein